MKDLVEYVVRALVDHPEDVVVTEVNGGPSTIIELSVDPSDMGRVIGKGGRIINAVRSLVQVVAAKQGKRVSLELVEDADGSY